MVGKKIFNVTEAEEKLGGNNKKLAYCLFVKVHIIMLLCNTHKNYKLSPGHHTQQHNQQQQAVNCKIKLCTEI